MSELLRFFKDMRDNGYGLAEIAAQLGTSAIAEPVAGFAAMYDPVHGADAIREGMTYQPRTQAAQEYSQSVGNAAKTAIKPAMPIIDAWQQGVDIAGRYSPVVGAGLRTVPTAIGIAMGAKPALQAGRQVSEGLGAMQGRMIANANAPRTLNMGFRGQRGAVGIQRPLTEFEQAHLTAQRNAALPVEKGGLGLPADNTAMDRARAMGFDVDNPVYHGTDVEINGFSKKYNAGKTKGAGFFFTDSPDVAATYTGVNGGNTIKALLRNKEPLNIDVKGGNWSYLKKDLKVNADEIYEQKKINKTLGKLLPDAYKYEDAITTDDLARWANNKGYSSVNFKDVRDRGGEGAFANARSELPSNNTAIFEEHNIRSANAAFDPKNKWSSNLLAQSAKLAPTTALGAYMYNEKRKKSQGKQ